MEEQNNQPSQPNQLNSSAPVPASLTVKSKSSVVPLIVAVVLTAVVIGGGIYWWFFQEQATLNSEIINLQNQNSWLSSQLLTQTDNTEKLNNELIEIKVSGALSFLGIADILRDPQDKNKFYYIRPNAHSGSELKNPSGVSEIVVYNSSKDNNYQQNGNVDITMGSSVLLSEKVGNFQEFRIVGIIDNKLVFVQTSNDNSPGPCSSLWLFSDLNYIDVSVFSSTKQSYVLSDDIKNSEMQKGQQCQVSL